MIDVKHTSGDDWAVAVRGSVVTHHRVRVTNADLARFAEGRSAQDLLQESFRFLLEREANTSILTSFDLPLISSYFPEYEQEIRERVLPKTSAQREDSPALPPPPNTNSASPRAL